MTPSVLFIAPTAYSLGGVATWLDSMEQGLVGRGWPTTIGLASGPRYHRPDDYLAAHPHRRWVEIFNRSGTPEGRCRAIVGALADVQPDIVVGVNIPDAFAAVERWRRTGGRPLKAVMAVHGLQPDLNEDMRRFAESLDGVVCTNRLTCALAADLGGISPERIDYAPYGLDLPGAIAPAAPADRLHLLYVGRLEQEQKRIGDIPEVLDRLQELGTPFVLRIAGAGPEGEWLQQALGHRVANGEVEFLGRVSQDDLRGDWYPKSAALLLTSSWETGPIVAWEAMAAGVVVVSSRYVGSGLEGALRHDDTALLFPVGAAGAAARELARLWEDAALAARLRDNGRQLVRQRYSVETSIRAWESGLRRAFESEPRPVTTRANLPSRPSGRLDRLLGVRCGETLRRLLRRTPPATGGAGAEWPHSYGRKASDDPEFWAMAAKRDEGEAMK